MIVLRNFSQDSSEDALRSGGKVATGIMATGAVLGGAAGGYLDRVAKSNNPRLKQAWQSTMKNPNVSQAAKKEMMRVQKSSLGRNVARGAGQTMAKWALPAVAAGSIYAGYKNWKNKKNN